MLSPGRAAVLLGLLFGLAGTSTSAVTVALPRLAADLGVSRSTAAWVVSGFAVAFAVATPLQGRLGDMLGIRLPLVTGIVAMSAGAALAAVAPSFAVLVPARVLQGVGAAAVPVLATALVTTRYQDSARSAALGRIAGVAAMMSSVGPLAGGVLEGLGGWRLTLALPVVGLAAVVPLWRTAPALGTGERIDLPGAALVALTATGLVLILQSPSAGAAAALVGVALLVAAGVPLVVRVRIRPEGFLPRAIITNGTVLRSAFATAAVPATWFALLLGVPFAATSWGWSPLATGLLLLPSVVIGFVSPRLARVLLDRIGPHRSIGVACPTAIAALGVAALGGALESPGLLALAVALVTTAFGVGQPAMMSAVGSAVAVHRRGVAVGIATLVFLVGASAGAALVGGLADVIGVAATFAVLVALPVGGITTLLLGNRGGRDHGDEAGPFRRAA